MLLVTSILFFHIPINKRVGGTVEAASISTIMVPKKPTKKKNVYINNFTKQFMLYESRRSEKTLILDLKKAFSKLETNKDDESNTYIAITRALVPIDRKIDYIGWKDVTGLSSVLQTGIDLMRQYSLSNDNLTIENAKDNINRMYLKVKNMNNTKNNQRPRSKIANDIKVLYGNHDYDSLNQKEYDTVIAEVNKALNDINKAEFGGEYSEFYYQYLDGERWSGNRMDRSDKNIGLFYAGEDLGEFVSEKINKEDIIKAYKTLEVARNLTSNIPDIGFGSTSYQYYIEGESFYLKKSPSNYEISLSAYDGFVRRLDGAEAVSQINTAVFDVMGYKTKTVEGALQVQIGGKWWGVSGSGFFYKPEKKK